MRHKRSAHFVISEEGAFKSTATNLQKIATIIGSIIFASTLFGGDAFAAPQDLSLLQQSDITYLGAFKVPSGDFGSPLYSGFTYGGTGLAYNQQHDSLFIVGHNWHQLTAEISIPQIIQSTNTASLAIANVLQPFADVTEGNRANIGSGGAACGGSNYLGGLLVFNNKLIGTSYSYYDAGNCARLSHFMHSPVLSESGTFFGMYQVGSPPSVSNTAFVDGYMALIPPDWQPLFGGPVLTGNAALSIISRTSLGPAASVFDPEDMGTLNPVPVTPVVGYPLAHPTLGTWGSTVANPVFNMSTSIKGLVFPWGTRSVLFFGKTGLGAPCYGPGTNVESQAKTNTEITSWFTENPGETSYQCGSSSMSLSEGQVDNCCYDPDSSAKGTHAYPNSGYVWAYDANDLISVKNGIKNIWDVVPYATWTLGFPVGDGSKIVGAAYDQSTQRIFISQYGGEKSSVRPIIHVFHVNAEFTPDAIAPAVPSGLRVD